MVLKARPPVQHEKGAISGLSGVVFGKAADGNGVLWKVAGDGAPTDGTSGDGAGWAGKGSEYTDYTNAKLYINTGTRASPTWTVVGTQS